MLVLTIKIEVDTDPPPAFETDVRYLLSPIPFTARVYALPDLFAGKMHALLCRRWKTRVKGRDWYDLVWFAAHHPTLHRAHLEARMVQSGHWPRDRALTATEWRTLMDRAIDTLNLEKILRNDIGGLCRAPDGARPDPDDVEVWHAGVANLKALDVIEMLDDLRK